jgi:hypothetical protein
MFRGTFMQSQPVVGATNWRRSWGLVADHLATLHDELHIV